MLKTWQYVGIAGLILLLFGLFLFWDKIKAFFSKKTPPVTNPTPPAQNSGLNINLLLKNGVYNSEEVKLLQTWMGGITADGDFGPQTEARLMAVKGVKEVTLSTYPSLPNTQAAIDEMEDAADSDSGNWFDSLPYGYLFK